VTERFERATTVILVLAAIVVAGSVLHRELGSSAASKAAPTLTAPTFMPMWKKMLPAEAAADAASGKTVVVEFSDLECPFCRRFHQELRRVAAASHGAVTSVFIHFPLGQHRFAIPAARAAECARAQHQFDSFVDQIFSQQDSLGLKPWEQFAHDAGVADLGSFNRCNSDPAVPSVVTAGRELGKSINVAGTPTIIINGWRFGAPPYDSLSTIVARVAKGLPPQSVVAH
jgi:protein-disulfide isomerase